jgi:hypothetical protein
MKVFIIANGMHAPQIVSCAAFGLDEITTTRNGCIEASQEFRTIVEAREYLKAVAEHFYEGEDAERKDNHSKNSLTINDVTARIYQLREITS